MVEDSLFSERSRDPTEDAPDAMDEDEDHTSIDKATLVQISQAAVRASQVVSQAYDSDEEPRSFSRSKKLNSAPERFFAHLLDPVKRSDMRKSEFADFIDPKDRSLLELPKKLSKAFIKTRADKFVKVVSTPCPEDLRDVRHTIDICLLFFFKFDFYTLAACADEVDDHLLHTFERFLDELMLCFDHPKEAIGFNPFAAFADLVEAGALVRTPDVLKSCSRLMLGTDWSELTPAIKKRIGPELVSRLYEMAFWRVAEVDELLTRWSDKFRTSSTCAQCNTDAWEIFLLTLPVALKKHGTRYVDKESASDTSSESGADEESDEESSDEDDHDGQLSDSTASDDNSDLFARALTPISDSEEPPRATTSDFKLSQGHLRNYGPNIYLLRIVSMDEFGCGVWERAPFKVCPRCGYRFDGGTISPTCRFARVIRYAVDKAREQIAALPETIELP